MYGCSPGFSVDHMRAPIKPISPKRPLRNFYYTPQLVLREPTSNLMDHLKCNILACRTALTDKAVVTTCSHIFCVECANRQFNDSRLCPACETSLTEPDDVVVCSLHPTNDYKTSVLSGLNPAIVLEICSRAMSFWQYQMHQELSFQQTVLRTINDKSAYLQKELDNAVREARGQISLLNNKLSEVERDLDLERKKTTTLRDSMKDREKEYQKLKIQYDKMKRKTLLAPGTLGQSEPMQVPHPLPVTDRHMADSRILSSFHHRDTATVDVGAVVGDMNATGVQRTPILSRNAIPRSSTNRLQRLPAQSQTRHSLPGQGKSLRHGDNPKTDHHYPPTTVSDQSEEDGLHDRRQGRSGNAWIAGSRPVQNGKQGGFGPSMRSYNKFKPA